MGHLPQLSPPIPRFPGAFLSVPGCGVWSGVEPAIEPKHNLGHIQPHEIHQTKVNFMPRALSRTATMPEIPQLPLEPLTVRIPVAVQLTGIGRSKLYELIAAGEVDVVKIGASTLITVASLRRLIPKSRR